MKKELLPQLYAAVAQGALFGIVVFEKGTGDCLFINSMAVDMLGTDHPRRHILPPGEPGGHCKGFTADLLEHDGLYHDIAIQSVKGNVFIGNIGVRTLEFENQHAHLLMLQDVTVQKKLQRDIMAKQTEIKAAFEDTLRQNRQLKELDHAKDRFIALTTHELRTPLSAMVASAEILKLGLYDTPEQMKEFIDMIYDQGQHLQDLVNDILDFAKIQAGKMDFYLEKQDPVAMASSIMNNFTGMAETNSVTLVVEDPGAPMLCYFDELRLRQIISNMVNNAIKYNKPGGSVRLHFALEDGLVKIRVTDTGKGIPADQLNKVFNEFETIHQVAEHHKGTGLGMPISRKLTEGMGGKLCLTSEQGVGSTFWIELPVEKVLDAELYRPRPEKGGDLAA